MRLWETLTLITSLLIKTVVTKFPLLSSISYFLRSSKWWMKFRGSCMIMKEVRSSSLTLLHSKHNFHQITWKNLISLTLLRNLCSSQSILRQRCSISKWWNPLLIKFGTNNVSTLLSKDSFLNYTVTRLVMKYSLMVYKFWD